MSEHYDLGEKIYYEYEHSYNSHSRGMRSKRAIFLQRILTSYKEKALIYIIGNKNSSLVEFDEIYKRVEGEKA